MNTKTHLIIAAACAACGVGTALCHLNPWVTALFAASALMQSAAAWFARGRND